MVVEVEASAKSAPLQMPGRDSAKLSASRPVARANAEQRDIRGLVSLRRRKPLPAMACLSDWTRPRPGGAFSRLAVQSQSAPIDRNDNKEPKACHLLFLSRFYVPTREAAEEERRFHIRRMISSSSSSRLGRSLSKVTLLRSITGLRCSRLTLIKATRYGARQQRVHRGESFVINDFYSFCSFCGKLVMPARPAPQS